LGEEFLGVLAEHQQTGQCPPQLTPIFADDPQPFGDCLPFPFEEFGLRTGLAQRFQVIVNQLSIQIIHGSSEYPILNIISKSYTYFPTQDQGRSNSAQSK
jgi:hypothetical protein